MALDQTQIDSVEDAVADVAANPAEIQTEAARVKEHPLPDLIEADRYVKSKSAKAQSSSPLAGLRMGRVGFGGTTGDN